MKYETAPIYTAFIFYMVDMLKRKFYEPLSVWVICFNLPKTVSFAVFTFDDAFPCQICGNGFDGSFGFAYMRSDFFLRGFWLFS